MLRISVTETHIKNAKHSRHRCPIALAIGNCEVGWNYIINNIGEVFKLPSEATSFLQAWDDGRPVEPLEFYLCRT